MNLPLLTVVTLFAVPLLGGADLQSLVKNSPFGRPPPAPAQSVVESEAGLEFRSLIIEDDRRYFSVFDPSAQRGYWISEGESDDKVDISVSSYDEANHLLVVSRGGRTYDLRLKQANIIAGSMPAVTTAASDNTPRTRASGGSAVDARRLEAVAAEVRRRRALRQAAATNAPATQ